MTLLQAVDGLNHRIEALDSGASDIDSETDSSEPKSESQPREISTGNEMIDALINKLTDIEQVDANLQKSLDMLNVDMVSMTGRWKWILVRLMALARGSEEFQLMSAVGR